MLDGLPLVDAHVHAALVLAGNAVRVYNLKLGT